jgi:geranylgeranyl diphosphate synthase type II
MEKQISKVETDLKAKLTQWRKQLEDSMEKLVPRASERPAKLHSAMRYSLEAGGKRIRPILLLAVHEAFGGKGDPLPAAIALECIHTYSLIHDDLPSIDNSDLRRGRPSCHKAFDEPTALLAGDALLTFAFQLIARAYAGRASLGMALLSDLSEAAGSTRLIGGQMEDIINENSAIEPDTLDYIHRNKTGAIITAALTMGLRFSKPNESQLKSMLEVGYHLGMAFQIIDDILDATQPTMLLGKPAGLDAAAGKSTFVALHGLEGSRKAATKHSESARRILTAMDGDTHLIEALIEQMGKRMH